MAIIIHNSEVIMKSTRRAFKLFSAALAALALAPFPVLAQQAVTLKIADFQPMTTPRVQVIRQWTEDVEKRSQGKIKFRYFPAESLLKASEMFEGVRTGVADVGVWVQAYNPAVSPLSALFTLPGVSPKFGPAVRAANELIVSGNFPYFRDELDKLGVVPVFAWGVADQEMISTKPVNNLAMLKGLKIRVIGREWPQLISQFGGTPVAMPWPEVYEALSRGTLDANVGFIVADRDSKLYEVAKYHTKVNLGSPAGPLVIINKKVWDGLSKEQQQIMRDAGAAAGQRLAEVYRKQYDEVVKELESHGVKFFGWDAADQQKLHAAMSALWGQWAKSLDAKGAPASEALKRYLDLQKKYDK